MGHVTTLVTLLGIIVQRGERYDNNELVSMGRILPDVQLTTSTHRVRPPEKRYGCDRGANSVRINLVSPSLNG
jgi:hypothetical protein